MFKRLIHPEAYDADIAEISPSKGIPAFSQRQFLRMSFKNIQTVNVFLNILVMAVLIYAIFDYGERFRIFKQDLLVMQEQIKKSHHLMRESTEKKHQKSSLSDLDHPLIEDIQAPTHLKYMGLFKSGNLQKALIETEQGGVLFTHNQMIDQQWKLKNIFQDRLLLESKVGQQVTIYKEPLDE